MAVAVVTTENNANQVTFSKSSGTSLAILPVNIGATPYPVGSLVLIFYASNPAAGTYGGSDSVGNTFVEVASATNGSGTSGVRVGLIASVLTTEITSGHTIAFDHPTLTARAMGVAVYSGVTATLDVAAQTATGPDAVSSTTMTLTPVTADCLVLAVGAEENDNLFLNMSISSSTTTQVIHSTTTGGGASSNVAVGAYRVPFAAAATAYSSHTAGSVGSAYAELMVAFRPAATDGVPRFAHSVSQAVSRGSNW